MDMEVIFNNEIEVKASDKGISSAFNIDNIMELDLFVNLTVLMARELGLVSNTVQLN